MAEPSVVATATSGATSLDVDGEGSSGTYIVKVADVRVSASLAEGCTLTVSSGDITKTGGTPFAYQVTSVADNDPAPTAGDFTVPSGNDYSYANATLNVDHRDLYVKYTTISSQDPGTYSATLSFLVVDN